MTLEPLIELENNTVEVTCTCCLKRGKDGEQKGKQEKKQKEFELQEVEEDCAKKEDTKEECPEIGSPRNETVVDVSQPVFEGN